MNDDESLVKHFMHSGPNDLRLSDITKERLLENIRIAGQELQSKRPSWLSRNLSGIATTIAAIAICGGLITWIENQPRQPQHPKTTTTTNNTKQNPSGFDYKKLLGFQPLLPAKVPTGYSLLKIQADLFTGAKIGDSYTFTAFYQNRNAHFSVWEEKGTLRVTLPSFAQKVTLNGLTGMWYEGDGHNFQFSRNEIVYRIEGGSLTSQQVENIASNLVTPTVKKPDQIIKHSVTQ